MTRPRSHIRRGTARGLAAAATLAGALAASACSPITTTLSYAPSDGIQVELDERVRALNLLVVTRAEGQPGALVGAVANHTTEAIELALTLDGARSEVDLPVEAGGTALLGTGAGAVSILFDRIQTPPGGTVPLTLALDGRAPRTIQVPVLDGTLEEYAQVLKDLGPAELTEESAEAGSADAGEEAGDDAGSTSASHG